MRLDTLCLRKAITAYGININDISLGEYLLRWWLCVFMRYFSLFSESCKLAQTSRLSGEKRLSKLNHEAAAIQKEFGRYKVQDIDLDDGAIT